METDTSAGYRVSGKSDVMQDLLLYFVDSAIFSSVSLLATNVSRKVFNPLKSVVRYHSLSNNGKNQKSAWLRKRNLSTLD